MVDERSIAKDVVIVTNNFRVYCRTLCEIDSGGKVDNDGTAGSTLLYTSHSTSAGDQGDALAVGSSEVIGSTSAKELVTFSVRTSTGTFLDGTLQAWSAASNPVAAQCIFSGWAFAH